MRRAMSISSSLGVKSTSRLTKLKRTPRTPAACSWRSSSSLTLRLTVATPRALPFEARQASSMARLSAPWQVACTITLRLKPRWSRSANSCALLASQGVYLRSGANGNSAPGPNTWQCASTLPGGSRKRGVLGPAYQSSQPGVFSNFMRPSSAWVICLPPSSPGCDRPRCASRRCARSPAALQGRRRRRRPGRPSRPGGPRCRWPTRA